MSEPKTKTYRLPTPFYRLGVTYPAGALVTVPHDFTPGKGWEEVSPAPAAEPEKAPAKTEQKAEPPKGKGRPSDASPL